MCVVCMIEMHHAHTHTLPLIDCLPALMQLIHDELIMTRRIGHVCMNEIAHKVCHQVEYLLCEPADSM